MSIIIKNLTTFHNNESIEIDAWISYRGEIFDGGKPLITIDCSSESDTKGEWYFGRKNEGGGLIKDEDFKNFVLEGIESHVKEKNVILNKLKTYLSKEGLN